MSTQLEALGITLMQGYEPAHLQPAPDMVVVGNVVTRGNAAMEYVLNEGLPYTSGPQWLAENVLQGRHVLAVAGTHGKTTTRSEEHTSELQSLMRISYAVFCLKKKTHTINKSTY